MKTIPSLILATVLSLPLFSDLNAQTTFTWTGQENTDWNNADNWDSSSGTILFPPTSGTNLIYFGVSSSSSVTHTGNIRTRLLSFSGQDYTVNLSGNVVTTFASSGAGIYADGVNAHINAGGDIQFNTTTVGSDDAITATNGGSLTLTAATGFQLGGSTDRQLKFDGDGSITLNGAIGENGNFQRSNGLLIREGFSGRLTLNTGGSTMGASGSIDFIHQGTGTVAVGANDALGSLAIIFENNASKIEASGSSRNLSNNVIANTGFRVTGVHALTFSGDVDFGSGNKEISVTETDGRLVLSGEVSGSGGTLTKSGSGILEITDDNSATWSQNVHVSQGGLLVSNAAGSATGTGNVLVGAGAFVEGSGQIEGFTSIAGQLRLTGLEGLRFGDSVEFTNNSRIYVGGEDVAPAEVSGDFIIFGNNVRVIPDSSVEWKFGEWYRLFDVIEGSIIGELVFAGGYEGVFHYESGPGGYVEFSLTAIPEPGHVAVFMAALTMILVMAFRRRFQEVLS